MHGGLMLLVAYGAQDLYLYDQRRSRFQKSAVEFNDKFGGCNTSFIKFDNKTEIYGNGIGGDNDDP